jgi:hypothetical protein
MVKKTNQVGYTNTYAKAKPSLVFQTAVLRCLSYVTTASWQTIVIGHTLIGMSIILLVGRQQFLHYK